MIQYQPGCVNVVIDALSRRPSINNISIVHIESFDAMSHSYAHDVDFSND